VSGASSFQFRADSVNNDARKFMRAARQRLTSAELLFNHGFHLDSIYVAGYVVECALKALILQRTPAAQRARQYERISAGRKAHDYEFLKGVLRGLRCRMPLDVAEAFRPVATWSTDLRYEVGLVAAEEAEAFLAAVRVIRQWVERSL
jgi:HEPN domain-containing protein